MSSLPLLKYSSTAQQSEPFHWVHISSPDLFVVFDSFQAPRAQHANSSGARQLQVVRGADLLETVDIVLNVQQANAMLADARSKNRQLRIHGLPISAMTRPGTPIIAIKYSPPDGMARRFQLRFSSVDDFRIALNIISSSGVQISESPGHPNPVSRASSSHTVPTFTPSLPASSPPNADFWHTIHEARRSASSAISGPRLPTINERPPPRPFTAPTDAGGPSLIPPRRELPFSRPPSSSAQSLPSPATSSHAKSVSNQVPTDNNHRRNGPLTSSAELPPLQPPRLAALSDRDNVSSTIASFGTSSLSVGAPSRLLKDSQGSNSHALEQHRPRSSSRTLGQQLHTTHTGLLWSDRAGIDQGALVDNATLKDRNDDRIAAIYRHGVSADNNPAGVTNPASPSTRDADLGGYASQSARSREQQLDGVFANCIHDENFILLCQDIASHWQRFYLGSI